MLYSQDRFSPLYISSQSEKFDFDKFDSIRIKKRNWATEMYQDSIRIYMEKRKNECFIQINPPNEYFFINKNFNPDGRIYSKGLAFIYNGFNAGKWYYYNKSGNLEKTIDHDAPFTFTFEQMLEFAKKEGVTFYRYPQNETQQHGNFRPMLQRGVDEKSGESWWKLSKQSNDPVQPDTSYKIEIIKVNGKTGKVISRELMDAKVFGTYED